MANRIYNKQVSPKGYKRGGVALGPKKRSERMKKLKNMLMKKASSRTGLKMGGGSLKAVPAGNKGLKKLPTEVRNKMGFMKKGGKVSLETAKEIVKDIHDKKGKVHSTLEGQKASLKRFMELGKKQGRFYPKKFKVKKLEQN